MDFDIGLVSIVMVGFPRDRGGAGLLGRDRGAILGAGVTWRSHAGHMDVGTRAAWRIETFGGLAVSGGAVPLAGAATQRKTLLLLAVIASAGSQGISRERLVGLFWPESDEERARNTLKQALHILRRDLREPDLLIATPALRLNPDSIGSDVQEFEDALARGALERAVALYRGPFLDGLYPDAAPELERWVERERGRLAHLHAGALEKLALAADAAGDRPAAVAWWRRLAATDPLSSRIAVGLMKALVAAGDPEAALQHARVHETLVRQELETAPDHTVVALAEQVRADRRTARPPVLAPAPAPVSVGPGPSRESDRGVSPGPGPSSEKDHRVSPGPGPSRDTAHLRQRPRRRLALAGLALATLVALVALVAIGVARRRDDARPVALATSSHSVAVLPFVDMSAGAENAYFGDGLSEELITALSHVEGLRVAARTSSFALRDAKLDVRTIGDTLGVTAVVEGSVRRDGDRLRVTAQLIDARTGYHLWAEEYDRELKDVFLVQDEIAGAIAGALRLTLATGRSAPTANREAYDLHLRATYFRNRLTREEIAKAVAYYDRAIALDSNYALAYAGKASAMGPLLYFRQVPNEPTLTEMRVAARRALALDDQLGEAHVAMGIIHFFYEWDFPAAEREYRRATELNPLDAHAFHHLANYLRAMGRVDDAIAARTRALELDPLNARTAVSLGRDHMAAGHYPRGEELYRRSIDIDSMSPLVLGLGPGLPSGPGEVYERTGRDTAAVEEYLRVAERRGERPADIAALRRAFAEGGMRAFWLRWLPLETQPVPGRAPRSLRIAVVHARLGDTNRVIEWLERAYTERDPGLVYLRSDPDWEGVRGEPRVQAIMRRMKLVP